MTQNFRLFGPAHLAIIAAIPAAGWALSRRPGLRFAMGAFLLVNETAWWVWRIAHEGFTRGTLPLQLCDLAVWTTILALFTLWPLAVDLAYYAGLAGAGMAVLTPDLWAPCPEYPSVYFFLEHGGVVAGVLMLVWSGAARPGPFWRAWGALNAFALVAGAVNATLGTNYMYLCRKPTSATALDWFGPWPWYLLAGEAASVALFGLLWLPWRATRSRARLAPAETR